VLSSDSDLEWRIRDEQETQEAQCPVQEELGRFFIDDFFQASAAPQTLAAAINSGS
jgi:hypothetical protein